MNSDKGQWYPPVGIFNATRLTLYHFIFVSSFARFKLIIPPQQQKNRSRWKLNEGNMKPSNDAKAPIPHGFRSFVWKSWSTRE